MESDSHLFLVEVLTDYNQYMNLKPPERMIKPRTAQYWVQQDQKEPTDQIVKNVSSGRPTGRPPKPVEEHWQFLIDLIDEKSSLVLDEIVTSLTEQLAGLNIKKSALHDFMTEKSAINCIVCGFYIQEGKDWGDTVVAAKDCADLG
ncbi:hypothetical protein G6F37_000174 [Rhizopus arrhizus]|nr:hypothetical protein G6F38_001556 [Rhizopus arrhizus]KAG1164554.1 hypothetical protein G6F37_000174 [Rhizopus arrhizus]